MFSIAGSKFLDFWVIYDTCGLENVTSAPLRVIFEEKTTPSPRPDL